MPYQMHTLGAAQDVDQKFQELTQYASLLEEKHMDLLPRIESVGREAGGAYARFQAGEITEKQVTQELDKAFAKLNAINPALPSATNLGWMPVVAGVGIAAALLGKMLTKNTGDRHAW